MNGRTATLLNQHARAIGVHRWNLSRRALKRIWYQADYKTRYWVRKQFERELAKLEQLKAAYYEADGDPATQKRIQADVTKLVRG